MKKNVISYTNSAIKEKKNKRQCDKNFKPKQGSATDTSQLNIKVQMQRSEIYHLK